MSMGIVDWLIGLKWHTDRFLNIELIHKPVDQSQFHILIWYKLLSQLAKIYADDK